MKRSIKLVMITLISILTAFLMFKYVAPLLAPFILAIFVSLAMEPMINLLQNKFRMSRGWSVILSMSIFMITIFLIAGLILRRLIIELIALSVALPGISVNVWQAILQLQKSGAAFFLDLPEPVIKNYPKITEALQANINSLINKLQVITTALINSLINTITGVTGLFLILVVAVIATYFFSRDRGIILRFWVNVLPEPWGRKSIEVLKDVIRALVGYIKAQLFLITMTMILTIIGLYIIGAKYALTMGILIGFFDLLPVLGPGTIYIPWIAYSFFTGFNVFGIKLAILYVVVMVIRQIVETKVVSHSIGLHPLATLIAMYVGLKLTGVVGMVLGPLMIIAIRAIAKAANITIMK